MSNNEYAIGSGGQVTYNNCIFINNNEINNYPISDNPIFRNCILDFELPPECIDGGGNIWVDSLQAQQIFEDIQNGDFHLASGSIAIDAGFDTLGYYYPFDLEYNQRVWDGDGDGNAIIDIGPYEYGAPELGKILGQITETDSGEPVDYVLIKIDNEPGNFTFSDSLGYFQIKLPAGTYDLYAERVFYEDNIVYSVTVEDEQTTEVNFNMTSTLPPVETDEVIIQSSIEDIQLSNHPNPFNPSSAGRSPSTTISFNLTTSLRNASARQADSHEDTQIEIYNLKGQKVKTLECVNRVDTKATESLSHSVVWNGKNDNGKPVASGVYFYQLKINNKPIASEKCLLLK